MRSGKNLIRLLQADEYPEKWRDVEDALKDGEDPNAISPQDEGVCAMHLAAGLGGRAINLMLEYGGHANIESEDGTTPLHIAASWGCKSAIVALLHHGAEPKNQDENGKIPYDLAVERGFNDCAPLLAPKSFKPTSPYRCQQGVDMNQSKRIFTSPNSISQAQSITQKLYKYLEEGTPVYFDVTSPDSPCVTPKHTHSKYSRKTHVLPSSPYIPCARSHHTSSVHIERTSVSPSSPRRALFDSGDNLRSDPYKISHGATSTLSQTCSHDSSSPLTIHMAENRDFDPYSCEAEHRGSQVGCHQRVYTNPRCSFQHVGSALHQHKSHGCSVSPCSIRTDLYPTTCQKSPVKYLQDFDDTQPYSTSPCRNQNLSPLCSGGKGISPHKMHKCCRSTESNIYHSSHSVESPYYPITERCDFGRKIQIVEPLCLKNGIKQDQNLLDGSSNKMKTLNHCQPLQEVKSVSKNLMERSYTSLSDKHVINSDADSSTVGDGSCKSYQMSKYSSTLASSVASPHNKVAAFVLSSADFMSQCNIEDSAEGISTNIQDKENTSDLNDSHSSGDPTVSDSSANTFETCAESPCIADLVKEKEEGFDFSKSVLKCSRNIEITRRSNDMEAQMSHSKWKQPLKPITIETGDFVSSDESYLAQRSPRIYRMKTRKPKSDEDLYAINGKGKSKMGSDSMPPPDMITKQNSKISPNDAFNVLSDDSMFSSITAKDSDVEPPPKMIITKQKAKVSPSDAFNALSDDSMFSSITAKEAHVMPPPKIVSKHRTKPNQDSEPPPNIQVTKEEAKFFPNDAYALSDDSIVTASTFREVPVKDEKTGIVFIERYIPSDYEGSVGRRSLDSMTSAATIDSQATLIYDWRTLGKMSKQENSEWGIGQLKQLPQVRGDNCRHPFHTSNVLSSQGSSGSSTVVINPSFPSQENSPDVCVPDHLASLSCEEISQRLQSYGELPGPVIASTKQIYLKRLTSLEANPGLISLSKESPDFPPELRQALKGTFNTTHMPMLEAKMVEEFACSHKQWREGTTKSSFNYLLLDPRVTENLPLRAKEMTDLEVFKTFICAIFYIGKGKRNRPYCHLHEAVRQMKTTNPSSCTRVSQKVQQVIDIWKAGLGVVSLHCFQSVIPVEAYTREACMIDAIGIHKLTNLKRGDYYGVSSTWSMQLKRQIGVYLLQKALQIFLADGERQICLPDLC